MAKAMPALLLLLASVAFAQGLAPEWLNEAWRASHYPIAEWYTGFAVDKASGQPDAKAYQSVERDAQGKLSESIVVTVHGSSALQVSSQQTHKGEAISTSYDQSITTASNAVLAKVDVKSYFDKKSGSIYAFAAVKKSDLAGFYRSSINTLFAFADKEFMRMEVLAEQGKKNSAFGRIQIIEDSLKTVGYWGSLLQAVESDNSYIKREQDFWQRLNEAKKSLEHGTAVYLDVSGIEDADYFAEKLGAQMQEKQCNCTTAEKKKEADYVVKINVRLGTCIENTLNEFGQIYCYANASVSVNSKKYRKNLEVKIPEAKGGWGNRNKEKATGKAIEELTNSLAEKIIQSINK